MRNCVIKAILVNIRNENDLGLTLIANLRINGVAINFIEITLQKQHVFGCNYLRNKQIHIILFIANNLY